ncbi:MAG: VWA domain-containing protein [Planctomycetes bacterium]|nr:VWA domain-containing protein [Planctomycetota bacterium]
MIAKNVIDVDQDSPDPQKDPDLVVVKINGRYLAFRRTHRSYDPDSPPSEIPESPAAEISQSPTVIKIDTTPPPSGLRRRCRSLERRLRVWLVSATVHSIVVLLLGVVVITAITNNGTSILLVTTAAKTTEDASKLQTFRVNNDISEFAESVAPQSLTSPTALPDPNSDFGEIPAFPDNSKASFSRSPLPPGPVGIANGDVLGRGSQMFQEVKSKPSGARFFGVQAAGNNFVFVVDSSSSMRGKRWRLATRELLAAIQRLSPEQSFYVIFFDAVPHPMFGKQIAQTSMNATAENFTRLRRWMRNIEFGQATSPQRSVEFAMVLKPDAVFLLTDGEFRDKTMEVLRDDNHTLLDNGKTKLRTIIHTIGFQSRASQELLMKIAEENGGSYRFVK